MHTYTCPGFVYIDIFFPVFAVGTSSSLPNSSSSTWDGLHCQGPLNLEWPCDRLPPRKGCDNDSHSQHSPSEGLSLRSDCGRAGDPSVDFWARPLWLRDQGPHSSLGGHVLQVAPGYPGDHMESVCEGNIPLSVSCWTEQEPGMGSCQLPQLQFSSVTQACPTLCDPMNRSTRGLPVHHQLPEFTQTHVHRVSDAIQPSHPLLSPSPPAPNPSASGSSPMSQLFAQGGQSIGVSASASVLTMNTQDWCPLGWTSWILGLVGWTSWIWSPLGWTSWILGLVGWTSWMD